MQPPAYKYIIVNKNDDYCLFVGSIMYLHSIKWCIAALLERATLMADRHAQYKTQKPSV